MSTKFKIFIGAAIIIIMPIAWYFLSPLWRVIELEEASPLETSRTSGAASVPAPIFKDAMDTMNAANRRAFESAVMEASKNAKVMGETMPLQAKLLMQGDFRPRAHDVSGRALLIEQDWRKILRFEDFETINGPRLHIYLSSDLGNDDFVDLGPIRATKGNVNYELPVGVDTRKYNKALVWCVTFGVLFSYVELQ